MANIIQSKEEIKDKLIQIIKENVLEFQEIEIGEDTKINTQKSLDSITFIYISLFNFTHYVDEGKIIGFYYLHLHNV